MDQKNKNARLFLWNGRALFFGPAGEADTHSHQALQIVVASGKRLRLHHDGRWHEHKAAIIRPDGPHRLHPGDDPHLLLLLDPQSEQALALAALLPRGADAMGLDLPNASAFTKGMAAIGANEQPCLAASDLADRLTKDVIGETPSGMPLDPRVRAAAQAIRNLPSGKVKLAEIAASVGTSESRLSHLFRQQMGLPMQRYLLWQRLLRAAALAASGADLTLTAHKASFADSAHFSRNFKQMFGLSPSIIFKKSGFVQVITCGSN